jgi:hypothetical protein
MRQHPLPKIGDEDIDNWQYQQDMEDALAVDEQRDEEIRRSKEIVMPTLKLISPENIEVDGATELYVSAEIVRLIGAILKEAKNTGDVVPRRAPSSPEGTTSELCSVERGDEPMKHE